MSVTMHYKGDTYTCIKEYLDGVPIYKRYYGYDMVEYKDTNYLLVDMDYLFTTQTAIHKELEVDE